MQVKRTVVTYGSLILIVVSAATSLLLLLPLLLYVWARIAECYIFLYRACNCVAVLVVYCTLQCVISRDSPYVPVLYQVVLTYELQTIPPSNFKYFLSIKKELLVVFTPFTLHVPGVECTVWGMRRLACTNRMQAMPLVYVVCFFVDTTARYHVKHRQTADALLRLYMSNAGQTYGSLL